MTLETNNQAQIDALNQKILDLPNLVSNGFLTTEQAEAKKEEFEEEILKLEGGLDISTEQPVDHDEQVSETEDAAQSAGFTDMADSDEDSDPDNLTQLNGDMPVDEDEFEESQSPEDEDQADATLIAAQKALDTLDFIEQDDKTAQLLESFNTQQNRFIPLLADNNLQYMVAISQLANAYSKTYRHTLAFKCADLEKANNLVGVRCTLDFDSVISDRADSYQIQAEKSKSPYASHGIVLDGQPSNNQFRSHADKAEIKHGSTFIATTGELPYDHKNQPLLVAYVKDEVQFKTDDAKRETFAELNPLTDIGIMTHKMNRQKWRNDMHQTIKGYLESAEVANLTSDLVPETAKAWKPFLVIAKMISDEAFIAVHQVMQKYSAHKALPDIYKVCAAVDLALPKFKSLITEFGFSASISQKMIDKWLEHYGERLNPTATKKALDDAGLKSETNQFCFGVNTTGYKIEDLEKLVKTTFDSKPDRVKALKNKMSTHANKQLTTKAANDDQPQLAKSS